jgi:hypothetical protein
MTDDEVLDLLARGNAARAEARRLFEQAYAEADSEIARCWAAHMAAIENDVPEERLRWDLESLRAARASGDPRASAAFPTVLANVGWSELLMARPTAARARYEEALASLADAELPEDRRTGYRRGIEHMLRIIDEATSSTVIAAASPPRAR